MQQITRLLKSIPSPKARPHLWATWFMVLNIYPAIMWWKESILYVILLSLWANIYSSIGADQAQQAKKEARNAEKRS